MGFQSKQQLNVNTLDRRSDVSILNVYIVPTAKSYKRGFLLKYVTIKD